MKSLIIRLFFGGRELLEIKSNGLNLKITYGDTFLSGKSIFISLKDLNLLENNNITPVFKIHHEIFHAKTYDNSINYLNKLLIQAFFILSLIINLPIIAYIPNIIAMHTEILKDIGIPYSISANLAALSRVLLFYLIYKTLKLSIDKSNYLKECLCDRYAAIMTKGNINYDELFKKSITKSHPPSTHRIACSSGKVIFSIYSSISCLFLFLASYIPIQENDLAREVIFYFSIASLSVILYINSTISTERYTKHKLLLIVLIFSTLLYIKSKIFITLKADFLSGLNREIIYSANDYKLVLIFSLCLIFSIIISNPSRTRK